MKLKKIASLMLAGVMAVSMLAGCSGKGTTGGDEDKNPIVPVASNAVEYAKDALSTSMKDKVDVVASAELNGWVKDIATDSSKLRASDITTAYTIKNVAYNAADQAMSKALVGKLQEKGLVIMGTDFKSAPNGTFSQSYGWMYAVSGDMSEAAAVEAAVNTVVNWATSNCAETVTGSNGTIYNCDYTAEISTLKVTNNSLDKASAWTVAIVLTQNLTKAANVEA